MYRVPEYCSLIWLGYNVVVVIADPHVRSRCLALGDIYRRVTDISKFRSECSFCTEAIDIPTWPRLLIINVDSLSCDVAVANLPAVSPLISLSIKSAYISVYASWVLQPVFYVNKYLTRYVSQRCAPPLLADAPFADPAAAAAAPG